MSTRAVAAIIRDGDKILLHQRHPNALRQAGKWENAGGKVEEGETPEEAIKREVLEELGVIFIPGKILMTDDFASDGILWNVTLFEGKIEGTPKITSPKETLNIKWFSISELNSVDLAVYTREDFVRFGWIK